MSPIRAMLLIVPVVLVGVLEFKSAKAEPSTMGCPTNNGGLTLPPGFCATVFADSLGHARHLTVAADGTVYVNTWSGVYFRNAPPAPGGSVKSWRRNV